MESLEGRKILVTGAGGFIGSHLAEQLCREGAEVRALVHYNALRSQGWLDHSPLVNDIHIIAGDVCDRDSVLHAMSGTEIVFHLAALIAIPYSYLSPASYIRTNAEGTLNVLQAARHLEVSRVVHTSTSEVYGTALTTPISEDHPLQGQSPYSASKIGSDKMVESFFCSFDLPVVTVRPFNTFGPRQSARAVIPTIISQCLAGNETINLGSLSPTRDLNYVMNTVKGFMAAAFAENVEGETINLGSGREISIGELVELILDKTGSKAAVRCDQERVRPRKSEVKRLLACNTKAEERLGWSPEVSLEDGLKLTIEWCAENMKAFRPDEYSV